MSVAIRAITRVQDADDVNVTPAVGVDEYALTYDHDTGKFVLRAPATPFDGTPYALLAGRAGGQTLYGGTAANDDITIHGTSDATRTTSYVILQPTAGNVGIGTVSPATALHVVGAATITGGIRPAADSTTALQLQNVAGTSILSVDTTNGRVGIGTTGPGVKLQIGASSGGSGVLPTNAMMWISSAGGNSSTVPAGRFDISMVDANPDYSTYIGTLNVDYGSTPAIGVLGTRNAAFDFPTLYLKSGNVGIGTSAPATALHVVSTAITSLKIEASGPSSLLVDNYPKDTFLHGYGGNSNTYPFLASLNNVSQATATYGWGFFNRGSDGNLQIASMDGSTAWVPALTIIRGTASVGIGTTAPATALHVVGAATITGGIRPASDGTTAVQIQNVAGTSILNVDTTNGRMGIGTTSPGLKLDVQETVSKIYQLSLYNNVIATNGKARIGNWNDSLFASANLTQVGGAYTQDDAAKASWQMAMGMGTAVSGADGFTISRSPAGSTTLSHLLAINSTGNVGINDTNPAEKLDVTGNANVTGVYKVDDVQVLSNRVIDARCADVANSGDATTDGLIDALRDALVAHGLIAAA